MPGGRQLTYSCAMVFNGSQNPTPFAWTSIAIGGCMSVDPTHNTDLFRDCDDASVPHRQRATQIPKDLDSPAASTSAPAAWATATSATVCGEDVTGGP